MEREIKIFLDGIHLTEKYRAVKFFLKERKTHLKRGAGKFIEM